MEFEFNPNLDYQLEAINSTVYLFKGQENARDESNLPGWGVTPNRWNLSEENFLNNLKRIQEKNGVPEKHRVQEKENKFEGLDEIGCLNFSISMETGTGKTYIYLRTIMELYEKYGWNKFVIVVPSVAIREGVIKNLKLTRKHFEKLYNNIDYNFFEYDSEELYRVSSFARRDGVEIMVMTLQSFNREEDNIMFQERDQLNGSRPVDLIRKTNPILILDEPQNMESENSKEAISDLNSLFTLRYSATHRKFYNLIYQLTPYDALKEELVKQIEVLGVTKKQNFNTTLIEVDEISQGSQLKARLTIHKNLKSGVKKGQKTVKSGDSLYQASNGVENYEGMLVSRIDAGKGYVEFSDGTKVYEGGSTDPDIEKIQRLQIRETIREHFEKALELRGKGIKVLSLFFIDRVDKFTGEDGFIRRAFREEFNKLKKQDQFKGIYKDKDPEKVMGSYFSEYKSRDYIENDTEAYELIMKDKENLLSLEEPVEFIFSHSALREGWDNPNVFNICTLNNTVSRVRKRQEIGRGVRLAVNQQGERVHDRDTNILTVIANESYKNYVEKLQSEFDEAMKTHIDARDIAENSRKRERLEPEKKDDPTFRELWDKLSAKTKYETNIESKDLIEQTVEKLNSIDVRGSEIQEAKTQIEVNGESLKSKLEWEERTPQEKEHTIPNLVNKISEETNLTKETVYQILKKSNTLDQVIVNPKLYLTKALDLIERVIRRHVIQNIKYIKIGSMDSEEIFNTIKTYSDKTVKVDKSMYPKVRWDSEGEKELAEKFDSDDRVLFFAKLPQNFNIPTPAGDFTPDWAILYQEKKREEYSGLKLYFVRESKFVKDISELREKEIDRIRCAQKHFSELPKVDFNVITSTEEDIKDPQNQILTSTDI